MAAPRAAATLRVAFAIGSTTSRLGKLHEAPAEDGIATRRPEIHGETLHLLNRRNAVSAILRFDHRHNRRHERRRKRGSAREARRAAEGGDRDADTRSG